MKQIAEGNLYRVTFIEKGYEHQEFVYKEDLIDRLGRLTEAEVLILSIIVEED